jgi:hypothetical protein
MCWWRDLDYLNEHEWEIRALIFAFIFHFNDWDNKCKHYQDIYKIGDTNDFNRHRNESHIETQNIPVCPIENEKKCEPELIY